MRLRGFLPLAALSTALSLLATAAARHPRAARLRRFVLLAVIIALVADLATPRGRVRGALARLIRSWGARVAIEGPSMEPTMHAGDWVLVDPDAYRHRRPTSGALVLAPDPREPERTLIKRVASVEPDGRLLLAGDDPVQSTDSRSFGAIDPGSVTGAPWFRYWPPRRFGPVS